MRQARGSHNAATCRTVPPHVKVGADVRSKYKPTWDKTSGANIRGMIGEKSRLNEAGAQVGYVYQNVTVTCNATGKTTNNKLSERWPVGKRRKGTKKRKQEDYFIVPGWYEAHNFYIYGRV